FNLLRQPLPTDRDSILARLAADAMVVRGPAGRWDVTNLGAVLFAKRLGDFRDLRRKAMRVILYRGRGRLETVREQVERRGYASGFESIIETTNLLLPRREVV